MNLVRPMSRAFSTKGPGTRQGRDVWNMLKEEFDILRTGRLTPMEPEVPAETDVLIIGGGIMGNSAAYWLKQRNPKGLTCTVVERDPTYTRSSTMLSVGGIRHQFRCPENVQMSLFTSEFLRNIREHLSVLDMDPPDVQFNPQGYMFLASEEQVDQLKENVTMQNELGAKVHLLTKNRLAQKFPWLNLEGVAAGSYGIEGEGWFDPYLLTRAFKQKNLSLGVRYVTGEVVGFDTKDEELIVGTGTRTCKYLKGAQIRNQTGEVHSLNFCFTVNCAGAWASEVAAMAGIGQGINELSVPLPVEPRKRYVYVVHCADGPGLEAPLTIDNSGMYFRREGIAGNYLCGSSPEEDEEPEVNTLNVDYEYYNDCVWPLLAHRIPKFENSKLRSAWAGFYDYNTVDQNCILGNHPYHRNFFFMNGFSGHGIQQAVAAGRALMELTLDNGYKTIDLSRLEFNRFITCEPCVEKCIV
ncbi:FAD-dependent oxidoreductase domain-containing protein 1-like [Liolophura sinensis]|uniref:FAD-dependent oxidoreductase domain-containing protein 1-like n=1 Tax=Liolophura sinensis TaxID=3198878 RepID=UPI003158D463